MKEDGLAGLQVQGGRSIAQTPWDNIMEEQSSPL